MGRWTLSHLLKQALFEDVVSSKDIFDAIDNHRNVVINYHSRGMDKNTGARMIQVYSYFINKSGNLVIRAFQPYGDTTSSNPEWKTFRVDRITYWEPKGTFKKPPEGYRNQDGESVARFREDGDAMASTMLHIAHFDDEKPKYRYVTYFDKDGNKHRKRSYIYKSDNEIKKNDSLIGQFDNTVKISDIKDKNGDFRKQEDELKHLGYDSERKRSEIDKAWAEWEANANGGVEKRQDAKVEKTKSDVLQDTEDEKAANDDNNRYDIDDIWSSWEKNAGIDRLGDEYFDDVEDETERERRRNDRIMKRRDARWQDSADNRRLWRKDANKI